MALTPEVIKATEVLTGLTEDQVTAIATLSANDEQTVINTKIGALHGKYDEDVVTVTGVQKNQGEKSYDFVKRVLGDFKVKAEQASTFQTQVIEAQTEIANLKEQIKTNSGDAVLKQALKDAESNLNQLKSQYETEKGQWSGKEVEFNTKISTIQVETQFEKALAGVKFKAIYPEAVQSTLLDSAKSAILGKYKPDWVEGTDGKKTMVFRDAQGEIVRNKANVLAPYTAKELLMENLKDVLETERKAGGNGSEPAGGKDKIDLVDISGAKNQIEADDLIVKYLMQTGETRGTASFSEKHTQIRKDNGVDKLPVR